ncbi:hypothetical protein [Orenia marismortui]|uniref:Uncharacterized protein n=1 Tax=Orenia marismortui TaxID=46469 RepID=A0A4R8H362_9FIRM|nr:hypothetical protein [Orenia marismortui]TDX49136.1 hypothetical protein C7959_12030 [Orenia marismortui]
MAKVHNSKESTEEVCNLFKRVRNNHPKNNEELREFIKDKNFEEILIIVAELEQIDFEERVAEVQLNEQLISNAPELLVRAKEVHEYLVTYIQRQGLEGSCADKMVEGLGKCINKIEVAS